MLTVAQQALTEAIGFMAILSAPCLVGVAWVYIQSIKNTRRKIK